MVTARGEKKTGLPILRSRCIAGCSRCLRHRMIRSRLNEAEPDVTDMCSHDPRLNVRGC